MEREGSVALVMLLTMLVLMCGVSFGKRYDQYCHIATAKREQNFMILAVLMILLKPILHGTIIMRFTINAQAYTNWCII